MKTEPLRVSSHTREFRQQQSDLATPDRTVLFTSAKAAGSGAHRGTGYAPIRPNPSSQATGQNASGWKISKSATACNSAVLHQAYENEPSDVPDKQLPQSATHGFAAPSKKGDDGVSGTSTQNGADMDRVDRGKDWPEIEELDSVGFKD
jgi:hypothetical protein